MAASGVGVFRFFHRHSFLSIPLPCSGWYPRPCSRTQSQSAVRRPLQRHTSNSSASLFFGPSIPASEAKSPTRSTLRPNHSAYRTQVKMGNRHTYSGNDIRATWEATPSKSPPFNPLPDHSEEDTGIDDFFSGPSDSSFAFTVIDSTP